MPSNFSSLRTSRSTLLSKLTEAVKQETSKAGADERFWKLTVDNKTGRGYARLRFLPAPKGEELPWARFYQHNFKGPTGAWLVEHCPTTKGLTCPICQDNSIHWNKGDESNQKIARDRKRKLCFISNILVIEDPAHPENNGKVFLYRYGIKIQDKIMDAIEPKYPDQTPCNPFDLWDGADFKLKAEKKDNFQNYDKSEFAAPAPIKGTDTDLEEIWNSEHSVAEFVGEGAFKSFESLEKRLRSVTTSDRNLPKTAEEAIKSGTDLNDDEVEEVVQAAIEAAEEAPAKKPSAKKVTPPPAPEDDEAALTAFFSKATSKK